MVDGYPQQQLVLWYQNHGAFALGQQMAYCQKWQHQLMATIEMC
jgi:hypothetical protein